MPQPADLVADLVDCTETTMIVDIGANPIDGERPYKAMLAAGLCRLIGFEPLPEAHKRLQAEAGPNERYWTDVIGDGWEGTLRICAAPGMTSLLEPDRAALAAFSGFADWGKVVRTQDVRTKTLSSLKILCDLLTMDIQGSESAVLESSRSVLATVSMVEMEVSFVPLYKKQKSFGEVDCLMRSMGFLPHRFTQIKRWPLSPLPAMPEPGQLLEADVVYARDFTHMEAWSAHQLQQTAMLAHHCYRSWDLALRCIDEWSLRRGKNRQEAGTKYVDHVRALLTY